MKRLTTYVINIDEDLAEQALRSSIPVLIELLPHIKIDVSSIYVEPHDDYRGVVGRFDFDYVNLDASQHKNASKALHEAINGTIRMQLWRTPAARVSSETSTL